MILIKALLNPIPNNSLNLYFSENFSKKNYAQELVKLAFKYKSLSVFQKNPFVFEYESLIEKFLTGIEISSASFECRDFLSKCLEVF